MSSFTASSGILPVLALLLSAGAPSAPDLVFERIEHASPAWEAGWRLAEAVGPEAREDGASEASFRWTRGEEAVAATVIRCRTTRQARTFLGHGSEARWMDSFAVKGLGDEAYSFPPIVHKGGTHRLEFRSGRFVVLMVGPSRETLERFARRVLGAMADPARPRQGRGLDRR